MEKNLIWLMDHKAKLGEFSPLNMDGSTWILGVCVLRARDREEAMSKFEHYLHDNGMKLVELYEFAEYASENYVDKSSRTDQINYAVRRVRQDGETCYVYARTSETMNSIEKDSSDE